MRRFGKQASVFLFIPLVLICLLMTRASSGAESARNIILLISDGCGYAHVDAAGIYQYGETGKQVYEQFPVRFAMRTGALFPNRMEMEYDPRRAWTSFDYVTLYYTDSAASATALSTGEKTVGGAIGVDAGMRPLRHITEDGKSVGVVTSVPWSHATPAGFVAHTASRTQYSEIAWEMLLESRCDLIMGCGHPDFDDDGQPSGTADYSYVGGPSVWSDLLDGAVEFDTDGDGISDCTVSDCDDDGTADPWTLIETSSDFQWLQAGPTPKRVLGIPRVRATLQCNRGGEDGYESEGESGETPYSSPLIRTVPTLQEMARGALNVLDNNSEGFFLMVEGGAVDWAAHGNNAARLIEEEIDFNRAVESVVQWVEENSNWNETLVIVTGDHETGYLTGPGSGQQDGDAQDGSKPVWNPLVKNGPGRLPGLEWHSGTHTNSLIPLYARGPGCDFFQEYVEDTDPVRGPYVDNTAVARVMKRSFGSEYGQ